MLKILKNHIQLTLFALFAIASLTATWFLYRRLFRDGIGATGYFDDEGGLGDETNEDMAKYPIYGQQPVILDHFNIKEFDSPDAPGSGKKMRTKFLVMYNQARNNADIPFVVNSGYRTVAHNEKVGGVPKSSHTRGWAADTRALTIGEQILIVRAARNAGFNRFGIYGTFIHLDCDPTKRQNVAWFKKNTNVIAKGGDFGKAGFPFDPFTV